MALCLFSNFIQSIIDQLFLNAEVSRYDPANNGRNTKKVLMLNDP